MEVDDSGADVVVSEDEAKFIDVHDFVPLRQMAFGVKSQRRLFKDCL